MCGLKTTDSCIPYFQKYKLLTFPSLYILETALFVKCNPQLFLKISDAKKMPTRSQYINKLCHVNCKTALLKKSFFGLAPRIYNKIPTLIRDLPLSKFKRALQAVLTEKCYYSLDEYLNDMSL